MATTFSTLQEVTEAVEAGMNVVWKTTDYVVCKSLFGDWYVTFRPWSKSPNTVGLYHTDGVNSEYTAADFFVA